MIKKKELRKRLRPGLRYWWLGGPRCQECSGNGLVKTRRCKPCGGLGRTNKLAKLFKRWKLEKPYALPMRFLDKTGEQYTWEDWHEETKEKYPARYFVQETMPSIFRRYVKRRFKDAKYWLQDRTTHKQHILDFSDKSQGYHRGYVDTDEAILLASFKLFCQFYKYDAPSIIWDEKKETKAELDALYQWWTVERPQKLKALEEKFEAGDEERLRREETEMLIRLASVRRVLWI